MSSLFLALSFYLHLIMHIPLPPVTLLALLSPCICSEFTPPSGHVVLERRKASGWTKANRLNPQALMPVRIGLSGSNLERGYEYLMDVASPISPKYGRHWTAEEVRQTFAPTAAALNDTTNWLQDSGIVPSRITRTGNGGYLTFDATIDELERLLKTEYYLYQHSHTEQSVAACDQ